MDQAEFGFNTSDYDTSYWDDEFENGNLVSSDPKPNVIDHFCFFLILLIYY